jgi:hypothetical protein
MKGFPCAFARTYIDYLYNFRIPAWVSVQNSRQIASALGQRRKIFLLKLTPFSADGNDVPGDCGGRDTATGPQKWVRSTFPGLFFAKWGHLQPHVLRIMANIWQILSGTGPETTEYAASDDPLPACPSSCGATFGDSYFLKYFFKIIHGRYPNYLS